MAYYTCNNCTEKHRIYGPGYTKSLVEQFGIKNSFEVPIMEEISLMSDSGTPFVLAMPDTVPVVNLYNELAKKVDHEIETMKANTREVKYDPTIGKVVLMNDGGVEKELDPYEMRTKCKCAGCIDEVDGRQILKVDKVPIDVYPTNMMKKGNYAVAVVWSDGHRSSIYPFERLLSSEFK
jgi:DUF971 family protein